jgi:hypothetical protein
MRAENQTREAKATINKRQGGESMGNNGDD